LTDRLIRRIVLSGVKSLSHFGPILMILPAGCKYLTLMTYLGGLPLHPSEFVGKNLALS
jgi:hypothetical protein